MQLLTQSFSRFSHLGTAAVAAVALAVVPACHADHKAEERQSLSVDGAATKLVLEGNVGDVEVIASAGATEVTAEVVKIGQGWNQKDAEEALSNIEVFLVDSNKEPGTVLAYSKHPKNAFGKQYSVDWKITMPADAALKVTISVGDVTAKGVKGGAALEADVGDIVAKDITGGLDARTNVGDISASGKGKLNASSNVGDVDLKLLSDTADDLTVRTNVGDITLTLPQDRSGGIDCKTGTGDISTKFGAASVSNIEKKHSRYRAQLGKDGGPSIILNSDVGDITVRVPDGV
ncbi:MAG TPA: DUF4097 family beta strand repeat-containing protein [Phycisphaerales bacterium]|nr:DUF4097 family beta strand repeat-containing protein [Phycisphaerales bacterium]